MGVVDVRFSVRGYGKYLGRVKEWDPPSFVIFLNVLRKRAYSQDEYHGWTKFWFDFWQTYYHEMWHVLARKLGERGYTSEDKAEKFVELMLYKDEDMMRLIAKWGLDMF